MQVWIRYVLISTFVIILQSSLLYSSSNTDTIPPVFTALPQDRVVNCDDQVDSIFIDWLNQHAFAEADNGEATVFNTITNDEALTQLNEIRNENCSSTGIFELGLFAIDSCSNFSIDTLYASFTIQDLVSPSFINEAQDLVLPCHTGIKDSLQTWLNNIGNAVFIDNCSDTITRSNYSWVDNQGNSGFSDPNDSTNIQINRDSCFWFVDVSFFIQDECSNINVTSGRFTVDPDTELPSLTFAPSDTIILCGEPIPLEAAEFNDGCDGILPTSYTEETTRSTDSLSCSFFNYDLIRNWSVTDICGNTNSYQQIIQVRDTLGPLASFSPIVAIDCDVDITHLNAFITVTDNCLLDTLIYQDSIVLSSTCQTQLIREYTVTDKCQNETRIVQNFQIQDFTAPEFLVLPSDTVVSCSSGNYESAFTNWVENFAGSVVVDNCNNFLRKAANPSNYNDTTSINNAPPIEFIIPECPQQTVPGILGFQIVEFLAYDECGNIQSERATYTLIDTVPAIIPMCTEDIIVDLEATQCETFVSFDLPNAEDDCSPDAIENWQFKINDDALVQPTIRTNGSIFQAGLSQIEFIYTDCGLNETSCITNVMVRDTVAPILGCPSDITLFLKEGACVEIYEFEELEHFSDNCFAQLDYIKTLPEGDGFIQFDLDLNDNIYKARNSIISFRDIVTTGSPYAANLTIDYYLNLSEGSTVTINSELGDLLYTIDESNCNQNIIELPLNSNQLGFWLNDRTINFTVVHNIETGQGTNPCDTTGLNGQNVIDELSYIKLSLSFSDVDPMKTVLNLENQDTISHGLSNVQLLPGDYQIIYEEQDAVNNTGSCSFMVSVFDSISPQINCKDVIVEAPIQESSFYDINTNDLIQSISDNCSIDTVFLSQTIYSCQDIGQSLIINLLALDNSGNARSCNSLLTVVGTPITPSFISDLCLSDSLQLFSGVDPELVDSFYWQGPSGFESNLSDPLLLDIDNSNSGVYFLEVLSENGCSYFGSFDIEVNDFFAPQIFTDSTNYCVDDIILLNASTFTEEVNYFWYEGIAPNGVLIEETEGPSLAITATAGKHFFYVEVQSESCASNPSNTISIDVLSIPQAEIDQPFITVCEGDDIVLTTDAFNSFYNYQWFGPNGYFSRDRTPEIISNANQADAGTYFLAIDNGVCSSDTASVQVVVFEKPETPIIAGESIFCEGQSAVLTISNIPASTRYHWYKDDILFNSVSSNNLLIPAISISQSGKYTCVVEDGICFSDTSDVFEIQVETSLNIGASNNGPLCDGDDVSLTSSFIPGATYLWEDPTGVTYPGREITVPAVNGLYTVTVTTASNCSEITSTFVEIGLRPEITALSNTSLPCMTNEMVITFVPTVFPQGNYIYEWTGPNSFSSNLEQAILDDLDENQNGTYSLQVIKDGCASEALTTEVNFTIISEKPIIDIESAPCEGDTLRLTIQNPSEINTTEWLWSTPTGLQNTPAPLLELVNFGPNNVGNYAVLQDKNGCRSEVSENLFVDNQSIPATPVITGQQIYCSGETIELMAQSSGPGVYMWQTPVGEFTSNEDQLVLENIDPGYSGEYAVQHIVAGCNSEFSQAIELEILIAPPDPIVNNTDFEFCIDNIENSVLCVSNSTNPIVRTYQLINVENGDIMQEDPLGCFDLSLLNTGIPETFELIIRAQGENCNSLNNPTVYISFVQTPATGAIIDKSVDFVCDDDFINLTAISNSEIEVEWSALNPEISVFNRFESEASFSNLRSGINTIILHSSLSSCRDFFVDTIEVNVLDEISAEDDRVSGNLFGLNIIDPLINDEYNDVIELIIIDGPQEGDYEITGNQISYDAPARLLESVEFEYRICYTDCPDICSDAIIIIDFEEDIDCFAGNVITPNGDGYNDRFEIPCLYTNKYPDNNLVIYNQWGDEVFSASPYLNDWEGAYNGNLLPVGSYFYILELGEGQPVLQGFLIIEL